MGKFNLSKKTLIKQDTLIAILYHDRNIELKYILKILLNNKNKILIILDGIKNIKIKKHKNLKIISLKKSGISKCRNFCIDHGIKNNFEFLIFFDSDCLPNKLTVKNHIKKQIKYKDFQLIGGSVRPTFLKIKKTSIMTKLDGIMSWFGAIEKNKDSPTTFPYHIPTLNMSVKLKFLKKNKIRFLKYLKTGEDYQFCRDIERFGGKIMSITNASVDHKDRTSFKDVIDHQLLWGRHQFYTIYSYRFKNSVLFNIFFIFLYLPLIPFLSFVFTFITLFPWIRKSAIYIKYSLFIFLMCNIKCFYSYLECINDLGKKLKF